MSSPLGAAFGATIAVVLLVLFSFSTFYMVSEVADYCSRIVPCVPPTTNLFGEGLVYVVTTVGGLVSALVIAQLAVTEPGRTPTIGTYSPGSRHALWATNTVISLYMLAWVFTGLAALVIGVMIYPKVSSTLSDIGSTWLGLAVSAAYAYLGIKLGDRQAEPQMAPSILAANDMSLGQNIPTGSEILTCGAIAKKITRADPEFAALVSNTNPKIEFKDEEATEADRMMTPRLQEKLNTLANLVASEWTGTKLRVTEAWDEDSEHSGDSLHYEGRAADLTTFPIDGSKLGRLGRLAVNAGCDLVFFEDSSHIHASVKR